MRKLILSLSFLLLVSSICFSQILDNKNLKITHGPYIQNLTSTSVSIIWFTNKAAVPSVNLGESGEMTATYSNSKDGLVDGGGIMHKVRIENLKQGTEYTYTPVSREILRYQAYKVFYGDTLAKGKYTFSTLNPEKDKIMFTVLNDIHERSALMAQFIRKSNIASSDLVFLNGDIINYLQDKKQIFDGFLDTAVYYFAREIPFFMVRGNHETRGMLARSFKSYFDFKDDKFYSAFTHGPVHFILLDCGEDKPDENQYYFDLADYDTYRLQQLAWLKDHVKSKEYINAKQRIVIVHMPIIKGEEMGHGMQFLADHYGPVLKDAGIDLLIGAHTHRLKYYSAEESGFDYPVLVSSNSTFVEVEADKKGFIAKVKDAEGVVVMKKVFKK